MLDLDNKNQDKDQDKDQGKDQGSNPATLQVGEKIPVPQNTRKPRKDKGKSRGPRAAVPDSMLMDIPIKLLLIQISNQLAIRSGNPALTMTDQEAKAIEQGLNNWVKIRAPQLSKYMPEIYLITPVIQYGLRIAMSPKPVQVTKRPDPVPVSIPQVIVDLDKELTEGEK